MATLAERFPRKEPERPPIPGYEIGEVIGRGATGTVYRARQLAVDREVALKVLHAELSGKPNVIQRLQREARTTARLAHPHVVSAIDMGQTAGRWWYAMEFVDGPSLAARLRQEGRLKEREALRLFIPLCEAIEHLWEHGVVHRDIKPANILIDRAGGARLADLGLAFADDDPSVTKQGGTLGTPHYISPEQTVDPTAADVRSDIWSFGATLFHAVCGHTPFTGESAAEILSNVLYARVPDPRELEPSLSKGLALVLRKCLVRDPDRRYQTPHELLLDLERVRERRQPNVSRRRLDPVRKRREAWKVWLPVLAILLLGVGLPFLLLGPLTDSNVKTGIGDPAGLAPYAPLEEIAERAHKQPVLLAQYRGELLDLRRYLADEYLPRWEELERELSAELDRRVRELRNQATVEIGRELESQDYRAAQETLDVEFPERVFERTGYRVDQLRGEGVSIDAWLEVQRKEIDERARAAAGELREALSRWSVAVRAEADRHVARREWKQALALLVQDRDAMLGAANLTGVPLPEPLLDEAVDDARTEMLVKRIEVRDAWTLEDQNLHRWVLERAARLRAELEAGPPRPRAAADLQDAFARELDERRISRAEIEALPGDLPRTCLEELARSTRSLSALEETLLEDDARADVAETDRLCQPLWRDRRYANAAELWREARDRLGELEGRTASDWLPELELKAEVRLEEGRLLEDFLKDVALRVRDLDSRVVHSLRVGLVDYVDVVIDAPDDPLRDGFHADKVEKTLLLRPSTDGEPSSVVLPAEQIEEFFGLGREGEPSPEDRLTLAAFRFHEGAFDKARSMLREGDLPEEGIRARIGADLLARVFDSMDDLRQKEREREDAAADLLKRIDADSRARAPSAVLIRVELLLNEYSDLAMVRDRLGELRALRERLREEETPSGDQEIQRIFGPSEIAFPGLKRVRMAFDFLAPSVGAWQRGDWIYDGAGWARDQKVQRWEELAEQRGPRLFLNPPLVPDSLEIDIVFEQSYPGPPQLVLVSVGGFHVALCGPGLPGDERRPRFLIDAGGIEEFVARIRAGDGTPEEHLVETGATHTLHLTVYRPGGKGGRLELSLDGRVLDQVARVPPREDVPSIEFRSWEPVTLKRVVIETGR